MTANPQNYGLWQHFTEIGKSYGIILKQGNNEPDDAHRKTNYDNAAEYIRTYPNFITNSNMFTGVKGFGQSIRKDIDEYLRTSSTDRLKRLQAKIIPDDPRVKTMELFESVYGIGSKYSKKFYDLGYRTLQDLWNSGLLNEKQKIGMKYREDLLVRIPREEIDYFGALLTRYIPNYRYVDGELNSVWYIAGSFRRGEFNSGDIDIIARWITMDQMINVLKQLGFILEGLAQGTKKFMGIIRIRPGLPARRLDIRIMEPNHYIYGLLYFTGSKEFNVLMRNRAKEFGALLNEYTLTDKNGQQYPVKNEAQIFELLGVKYLAPEQRVKNLTVLPLV